MCVLASPHLTVRCAVGSGVSADWRQATDTAIDHPNLAPYFGNASEPLPHARDGTSTFAMIFSPGNRRGADSASYEIAEHFKARSLSLIPAFGGSSADDWRMEQSFVLLDDAAYPDSVLIAIFETQLQFGLGFGHGYQPTGQSAVVTSTDGHEVISLDNQPARHVINELLGLKFGHVGDRHITLTTGILFGTSDPMGQYSINVASYFTARDGIRFAQPLQVGAALTVMEPVKTGHHQAAADVLRKALLRGGITNPLAALVTYCALRPRILGEDFAAREVAAMATMVDGAPVIGFSSFGELGLSDDGISRHNNGAISALVFGGKLSQAAQVAAENQRLNVSISDKVDKLERARRALHKANEDLEHRVAERTRALVERTRALELSEQSLRNSEEVSRSMMNATSDAAFLIDRFGQILAANETFAKRFGRTVAEITGSNCWELLPPDLAKTRRIIVARVVAEGIPIHTHDERDGYTLESRYYPVHRSGEDIAGIAVFSRDITAQREAEEQLLRISNLYKAHSAINESIARIVDEIDLFPLACRYAVDYGGMVMAFIVRRTDATPRLYPVARHGSELDYVDSIFLSANDDIPEGCGPIGQAYREGRTIIVDDHQHDARLEPWRQAAQRRNWRSAAAFPIFHDGKPYAVLSVYNARLNAFDDETVQLIEEICTSISMALNNFDRERKRKASEDLLERQARELTAINAELEQFAYVASHDLRQPLRTVASYLQLIESAIGQDLSDDLKDYFNFAIGGAKRMDRLILDLLEYSRVGRMMQPATPIALGDIVSECIGNLHKAIAEAQAEITAQENLPVVLGDRTELVRLFSNLIGNAVKYRSPDRPCRISITARQQDNEWHIDVSDNGIGMPEDSIDRAFRIFQRLVPQGKYEGSGIGLAICKKVAKQLGGRIWAESRLGEGSTFTIALPIQKI